MFDHINLGLLRLYLIYSDFLYIYKDFLFWTMVTYLGLWLVLYEFSAPLWTLSVPPLFYLYPSDVRVVLFSFRTPPYVYLWTRPCIHLR